jgi:hypothetical protein
MTPNMMNKKINKIEWVHHLLETQWIKTKTERFIIYWKPHWMKAQLSGAGVQSIRHPLNEKGAPQSNG